MIARAHTGQRRLVTGAWLGSAALHVGAVVLISTVRLAPVRLPQASGVRFFEVRLERPPPVAATPRPELAPRPKVTPRQEVKPPAKPIQRTAAKPKPAHPKPTPSGNAVQPRSNVPTPPVSPLIPRPSPQPPARAAYVPPRPKATDEGRPADPSGGGGPVDLGSPSPVGDLSGLGSGATPVGALPGLGTGTGSGTGPGSGPGPPGTARPATDIPPDKQPTAGHAGGSSGGSPPEPKPKPDPKPAHVSRVADRALPELVKRVNPQYPASAAEEGVEGTVSLIVTVATDGDVGKVSVSKSSGDARLDSAAVKAVKKWKYRPAVQDGIPRQVDTSATVTFRLN